MLRSSYSFVEFLLISLPLPALGEAGSLPGAEFVICSLVSSCVFNELGLVVSCLRFLEPAADLLSLILSFCNLAAAAAIW